MKFTREQLEAIRDFDSVHGFKVYQRGSIGREVWFTYTMRDLATCLLGERARAEAAEDKLHDAEEDFDTLNLEHTTLRARLLSAEAERDVLQWASDHAGGGSESSDAYARASVAEKRYRESIAELGEAGERVISEGSGLGKVRSEAENLVETLLPRMMDLLAEIKSEANACAMRAATKNLTDELADLTELEGECSCDMGEPLRPHDSLVWAILFASPDCRNVDEADDALEMWRARWPDPDEDNR